MSRDRAYRRLIVPALELRVGDVLIPTGPLGQPAPLRSSELVLETLVDLEHLRVREHGTAGDPDVWPMVGARVRQRSAGCAEVKAWPTWFPLEVLRIDPVRSRDPDDEPF